MLMTMQQPLFSPVPVDSRPHTIDLHAVSRPARTYTGDFWFTYRDIDRTWFALGDVAGKGLHAALVMAMIQEELELRIQSCARAGCDPATTMQRLHSLLRPILPANRFATAVLGWLRDDGRMRIVNAGHCPPLILRRDGRIERIGSTGPAAGILPASQWHSETLQLESGDTLLLYSDGVTESATVHGVEFGTEGIEEAVTRFAGNRSPKAITKAILDAVGKHSDHVQEDDLTLLVMQRPGRKQ
jgi:sigma-B regulation protein RsbU (phosphoserine phosphatase)